MSNKKKRIRYTDLGKYRNVFEPDFVSSSDPFSLKGCWAERLFGNTNPIILELACGKGDYTVQLAALNPEQNFIGIDIKGDRMWHGASQAEKMNLINTAFLRIDIVRLKNYFAEDEIEEIWITFPDPQHKSKQLKKRLTNPYYLNIYQEILNSAGIVHLKTDSEGLFEYTLETVHDRGCKMVEEIKDIYAKGELSEELKIKTYYENKYLEENRPIHYLSFQFPS